MQNETLARKRQAVRIRNGHQRGYTVAFAEKTQKERRAWITEMMVSGATDESAMAATGLDRPAIAKWRRELVEGGLLPRPDRTKAAGRPRKLPSGDPAPYCGDGNFMFDNGAYMRVVRRLNVAPPTSWRFGRDLTPLPSRPVVIRSTSFAGWCADEGDPHTSISDL